MTFNVPDYFPEEWADHEPSPIPEGVEVPDYFDYIFAFRQWQIGSNGLLRSLNGAEWPVGRMMEASCRYYQVPGKPRSQGQNEYAAVGAFQVIYDKKEIKKLIDQPLYGGDLEAVMKKRPVMIGSTMIRDLEHAKTGRTDKREAHIKEIPVGDCTCGIYATRTLKLLSQKAPWNRSTAFVGIVKFWGVGYEGSMGYRFQYGYPDRLFTHDLSLVPNGERYKVPVEWIRSYDDLFDVYGHIGR